MLNTSFTVVAHGALGPWDEVIFLGVAAVFLVFMGISWVRSRSMEPDYEDEDTVTETTGPTVPAAQNGERFELK